MTKEQLRQEINESLTYHGDDGTSGYLLSDRQLDAILDKVDSYVAEVIGPDEPTKSILDDKTPSVAEVVNPPIRNNLRAEMRKRAGL